MAIHKFISAGWFLFLIGILGMVVHFLEVYQKDVDGLRIKGGRARGLVEYFFKSNPASTIKAVIVYCVGFAVLASADATLAKLGWRMDVMHVFLVGYLADAWLNKMEATVGK